ncbi:4Fe-4S cluster-binding domain-containing protein [Heliobacillus mobilis]|uniref:Anaerobic ribonucleoside-triphosphate reductase-activating protein n=1 Tax=Heliobacterium mobile TaxID=28064 RepID=A0A6I3SM47_HELMO|nr:4Fe-4S single cluster domain-containing protein [Heliobacterium mobile]MTV50030.1 4Fe-4S cluster-binding domain-containing protein [Heliobacterium mobile]
MATVRIAGFNDLNISDADGIAFSIFFQGCRRRCPGCHNPELQFFDGGEEMDTDEIARRIQANQRFYDAVVFVGGEPMDQPDALKVLLAAVKSIGLSTWLYTGHNIFSISDDIIDLCDVIIAGEYRQELHTGGFPASSNQIIVDRRKEKVA